MQLSFSQQKYPKKQFQEGDTVVVVTPQQLATVNGIIQERNNYREQMVPAYEIVVRQQDSLVNVLNLKIKSLEQINIINQSIIVNLEQEQKELQRQKRKQVWVVGGISVGIGALIGGLIFANIY